MSKPQPNIKDAIQKPTKEEKNKIRQESNIRTILAVVFSSLYALFILFVIILWGYDIFRPVEGGTDKVKDLILTLYGVLSGPLGIVAGYYFAIDKNK